MRFFSVPKLICLLFICLLFTTSIAPLFAQVPQNFSVSAVVPPNASDFQFGFTPNEPNITAPQNTLLTYKITYGVQPSAGTGTSAMQLVATWDQAIAPNNAQLLTYVMGSGTNAYGNTPPVIDLMNHTITWDVPSLPAGTTNQAVQFTLKTTSNYTDPTPVNFSVKAKMHNQYVTIPEQTITQTYQYDPSIVTVEPTITPTATPTKTPSVPTQQPTTSQITTPNPTTDDVAPVVSQTPILPSSTPSENISKAPSTSQITDFSFTNLSAGNASILITTQNPVNLRVKFGTSPRQLTESITINRHKRSNTITFDGLAPGKTYYVQVTIIDDAGNETPLDIVSFRTAALSQTPELEANIAVLMSDGMFLVSDKNSQSQSSTALLTLDTDYEIVYTLKKPISIKSIDAIVRNKTLGISTAVAYAQESGTMTVPMKPREPSVYVAGLKTIMPGNFEVFVRLVDTKGNVTEQKIAELKVMSYLGVFDDTTKQPLADARVVFSFYNEETKSYQVLPRELFKRVVNPTYTNAKGQVMTQLPQGKYKATVTAFGYDERVESFMIGPNPGEEFPQIALHKNPTSIAALTHYYQNSFTDFLIALPKLLKTLSISMQFFNVIALGIIACFVMISFLLFRIRTHIPFRHLPSFFLHNLEHLFQTERTSFLHGIIRDEHNNPVTQARVECIDYETGNVITHLTTNKLGKFYLRNDKAYALKLLITKDGLMPKTIYLNATKEVPEHGVQITLQTGIKHAAAVEMSGALQNIVGLFFEFVLMLSLLLEGLFLTLFPFTVVFPFFALSLLNVLLWIFFMRERVEQKFLTN